MTKRILTALIALATVLTLVSCSSGANHDSESPNKNDGYYAGGADSDSYYKDESAGSTEGISGVGSLEAVTETARKRIQYVTVSLESTEYDETLAAIKTRAGEVGGYVESSNERGLGVYGNGNRSATLVFRIPADKLDEFQGELEGAGNVLSINISTDDVTEKYYDIEARLASLEAQRDRYMALLEEAKTLDEILVLDSALTEVLYQIESYTGTLNKYDSLSSYSTVTVNLQEVRELTEEDEYPEGFGGRIGEAFMSSIETLGDFCEGAVIVIISVLPWLVLPAVIVTAVVISAKKRGKKEKETERTENE